MNTINVLIIYKVSASAKKLQNLSTNKQFAEMSQKDRVIKESALGRT